MKRAGLAVLLLFACPVVGCATGCAGRRTPPTPLPLQESIPVVREAVLAELQLSEADRARVASAEPVYGWYRMSGDGGQATWWWKLPGGGVALATAVGRIGGSDWQKTLTVVYREGGCGY